MDDAVKQKLLQIHGDGLCHCGQPKAEPHNEKSSICSYPHGMLPVEPIDKNHTTGFWSWKKPEEP